MFGQQPNKPSVLCDANVNQASALGQAQTSVTAQSAMFGSKVIQPGTSFGVAQVPRGLAQQGAPSNSFSQMSQQTQNAAPFTLGSLPEQNQTIRAAPGDFGISPATNSLSQPFVDLQGFPSNFGQVQPQSSNTVFTPSSGHQQAPQQTPQLGSQLTDLQDSIANGFGRSLLGAQALPAVFRGFGTPSAMPTTQTLGGVAHQTSAYNFAQVQQQQPQQVSGIFSPGGQSQQVPQSLLLGQQTPNPLHAGSVGKSAVNSVFGGYETGATPSTGSGFGQINASTGSIVFGGLPSTVNGTSIERGLDEAFFIPVGTSLPFRPIVSTDTMVKNGVTQLAQILYQCITCMKEYENKSLEELRVEDYLANRKQGPLNARGIFSMTSNINFDVPTSQSQTNFTSLNHSLLANFGQSSTTGSPPASPLTSICARTLTPTGFRPSQTPNTPFGGFNAATRPTSAPSSKPFVPNLNFPTPFSTCMGIKSASGYHFGLGPGGSGAQQNPLMSAASSGPINQLFEPPANASPSSINANILPMPAVSSGIAFSSSPAASPSTPFSGIGPPGSATFGPNPTQRK